METLRRQYDLLTDEEKADFLRFQQNKLKRSLQKRRRRIAAARNELEDIEFLHKYLNGFYDEQLCNYYEEELQVNLQGDEK